MAQMGKQNRRDGVVPLAYLIMAVLMVLVVLPTVLRHPQEGTNESAALDPGAPPDHKAPSIIAAVNPAGSGTAGSGFGSGAPTGDGANGGSGSGGFRSAPPPPAPTPAPRAFPPRDGHPPPPTETNYSPPPPPALHRANRG